MPLAGADIRLAPDARAFCAVVVCNERLYPLESFVLTRTTSLAVVWEPFCEGVTVRLTEGPDVIKLITGLIIDEMLVDDVVSAVARRETVRGVRTINAPITTKGRAISLTSPRDNLVTFLLVIFFSLQANYNITFMLSQTKLVLDYKGKYTIIKLLILML